MDTDTVHSERARDDLYFALSNYRRRFVIQYLHESGETVSLRTLTEALAAWENDVVPDRTTAEQRKRAYVSLRQSHLPKLDELGIVRYDSVRGFVESADGMDDIVAFREPSTDGRSGAGLYRYLSAGIVIVFTVMALGITTI
jgi:hypothetical protein